ncbi:uncharacterized protein LOC128546534 [Mercenaria mercenaria]|uniref:uncharacterized protein LOC128546534 n=1 Tax=Mercenaria mercenaria TaxID=6596 RepID=UPI00234F0F53|nr:uncharacterized protein LOC128546534 [Mercenaria mercenaria]
MAMSVEEEITRGHEPYLRHLLLLGQAAPVSLKAIIEREVCKRGKNLAKLLVERKDIFKTYHNAEFCQLFKGDEVNTDIDSWDTFMLCVVVLVLFESYLATVELEAITVIKDQMNDLDYYAHSASISYKTFEEKWVPLHLAFLELCTGIPDQKKKFECLRMIHAFKSEHIRVNLDLIKRIKQTNNATLHLQMVIQDKVAPKIQGETDETCDKDKEDDHDYPVFTEMLKDKCVYPGESVVLTCRLNIPEKAVTWQHDNKPVQITDNINVLNDKCFHWLVIARAKFSDAGLYSCAYGSSSTAASLTVLDKSLGKGKLLMIEKSLHVATKETDVRENLNIDLICVVNIPANKVVWRHNGREIKQSRRHHVSVQELEHKLTIRNAKLEDNGEYAVDFGDAASSVTLTFNADDDPRRRKLFEDAIKYGMETDQSIRVMVIGCYNQGKTTLVRRLQGQSIEDIESTNGIDIHKCANTANGIWQKQNTENDEDEKIKRIAKVMMSHSNSDQNDLDIEDDVIGEVDFDECKAESTQATESQVQSPEVFRSDKAIESQAQSPEVFRSDKPETVDAMEPIQDHRIHQQKEMNGHSGDPFPLKKVLLAMEENENVKETIHLWDFGGQFVFYATHQLFHSRHAVYLLVFDLSKPLDHLVKDDEHPDCAKSATKSMKDYIEFWVNSVHSFVSSKDGKQPQIVLVGTHTDKLKDVKKEAQEYFEAVRRLFDGSTLRMHLHPKTFEMSGTDLTDKAIQPLRETIFDIGRANIQNIPARWIPLEKALTEIRDENIIHLKRLQEIDGSLKYPINKEEHLKFFLEFHHTKGTILYFDDSKLAQFVVLNPPYIVDSFKCIITSREFCITDGTLRPLWQQLTTDAILRPELIQYVWGNGTENRFRKFKDVLLLFLQKLRIIAEAQMFDMESDSLVPLGYYIVPSFLRKADDGEIVTFLKERTCTTVSVVYAFENEAIVPTIFQRVLASSIGTWPIVKSSDRSLLFENACAFKLDLSYAGIILRQRKMIELSMAHLSLGENVFGDKPDYFRRFVEYVIGTEFGKLQTNGDDLGTNPFQTGIRCFHKTHEYTGSKEIYYLDDLKLLSANSVSCPDNVFHEGIRIEQIFQQWFFQEEETLSTKRKIPQRKLSEKEYVKLSCDCIGSEWKMLARQLEISEVRISHIEMDNQNTKDRIYEMLLEWDAKDRDRATLDVLVKALDDISSPAVKLDTLKNIIDSFYCQ